MVKKKTDKQTDRHVKYEFCAEGLQVCKMRASLSIFNLQTYYRRQITDIQRQYIDILTDDSRHMTTQQTDDSRQLPHDRQYRKVYLDRP